MNFDQAKALRLQQWRSTLDDHDFRMQKSKHVYFPRKFQKEVIYQLK